MAGAPLFFRPRPGASNYFRPRIRGSLLWVEDIRLPYQGALTLSGNEITDLSRAANTQGDGLSNDSSFGIWPAATNRCTNGGAETNVTGTSAQGTNTIARSTVQAKFGSASFLCTYQDNITLFRFPITLTAAAHKYSVWVWIPSAYDGTALRANISGFTAATGGGDTACDMSKRDQWQRVICPVITPDAGDLTGNLNVYDGGSAPTAGKFIYVDGVQVETGSVATPYIETDGATASRTAARAQMAYSGAFSPTQGWVAMRVRMAHSNSLTGLYPTAFYVIDGSGNVLILLIDSGATLTLLETGGTDATKTMGTYAIGDYKTLIARWTSGGRSVSVDGSTFGTNRTRGTILTAPTNFDIGSKGTAFNPGYNTYLWFACGSGTLTDADAAAIHAFGNTDPRDNWFPVAANITALWHANTGLYLKAAA